MCKTEVFDVLKYRIEVDGYGARKYLNVDGLLHRVDGPAVVWSNGSKFWFQNGRLQRTDGPAVEYPNGSKEWWQNGQLHRTDGPAIEHSRGLREWWLNGVELSKFEFEQAVGTHND